MVSLQSTENNEKREPEITSLRGVFERRSNPTSIHLFEGLIPRSFYCVHLVSYRRKSVYDSEIKRDPDLHRDDRYLVPWVEGHRSILILLLEEYVIVFSQQNYCEITSLSSISVDASQ